MTPDNPVPGPAAGGDGPAAHPPDHRAGGTDPALLRARLARFRAAGFPDPPATVLDVGCGDGGFVEVLIDAGYAATGIDPDAPPRAGLERVALEALARRAPVDVVTANLVLHHVADLAAAARSLRRLVGPGGFLALDELDIDIIDEAAFDWLQHHGPLPSHGGEPCTYGEWRAGYHHMHGVAAMRAALEPWFALEPTETGPYLHHWLDRPDLAAAEADAISAGTFRPAGRCWWAGPAPNHEPTPGATRRHRRRRNSTARSRAPALRRRATRSRTAVVHFAV